MYQQENSPLGSVCFTGHRDLTAWETVKLKRALRRELEKLIRVNGVRQFYTGGARGFDTLAALAVLEQRKKHPEIRLTVVIPCAGQEKYWSEREQSLYRDILQQADEKICLSRQYYNGCMQRRNRFLVDNAGCCVAFLKKETGGTAYTVRYAREKGKPVLNLASKRFG